jgi:hypothetical protein
LLTIFLYINMNINDIDVPFDIRQEVDITKAAIDDPKEQAILAAHIKEAKESLRKSQAVIPTVDLTKRVDELKVRFNTVLSKLTEKYTDYDDLHNRLNIEGDKPTKRASILKDWQPVNIDFLYEVKSLQAIYTEWTIITANQLNK